MFEYFILYQCAEALLCLEFVPKCHLLGLFFSLIKKESLQKQLDVIMLCEWLADLTLCVYDSMILQM